MRLQSLVFLVVATALLALGHLYLYRRLVLPTTRDERQRRRARIALYSLALLLPLTMVLSRALPRVLVAPLAWFAYSWMGLLSFLFVFTLLSEPLRRALLSGWTKKNPSGDGPKSQERRELIERAVSGAVALSSLGATSFGAYQALSQFRVERVEVTLKRLPAAFDGYQIAQVSDIHVGPTIGGDFVSRMVDCVLSLKADLIAVTGDLVDGSVAELGSHTAPLARLVAPDGTYFVTGNHEYYSGADQWVSELARLGIPTLRNERRTIERGNDTFYLAGVTDHSAAPFGDGPDYERALGGRDLRREMILLAHQPRALEKAREYGVGLQLSGHTHAGQFWPWTWVVALAQPVVRGLSRFGDTQIYVNQGTGYWGPPLRTGTEPEITLITLRSEAAVRSS